jgi:ribosomal protein S27AE
MRCARCGGLTVLEEFKDFGLESCGNGFWGRRCVNCGAIVDLVIAAHQCVTFRTAACNSIVIPVGSSLPLNRIEQRITTRS